MWPSSFLLFNQYIQSCPGSLKMNQDCFLRGAWKFDSYTTGLYLTSIPFGGKISLVSAAAETLVQGWCFSPISHVIKVFHDRVEDQPMHYSSIRIEDWPPMFFVQKFQPHLLRPAPTGTGTTALAPTFGSSTLLEPVSH